MFPGETVCSGAAHPGTEPEIMKSPAGLYVGFMDKDGLPYSRETVYVQDKREAVTALAHVVLELEHDMPQPESQYIRR